MFFPFQNTPRRARGRAEIDAGFKSFFDEAKKRKPNPPFLNIAPKDTQIQMFTPQAAIVTFHLEGEKNTGRRTIIFQKIKGKWLIVHLHASTISKAE